jgi:hypothetical protein
MRIRIAAFLLAITTALGPAMPPSTTYAQTAPAPSSTAGGGTGAAARIQAQQDFIIVNNTGHTVMTLNVSAHSETNWGPDVLHGDKLGNGESAEITFDRSEMECTFDIKATYDDGDSTDLRKVNLCEVATVTLTGD